MPTYKQYETVDGTFWKVSGYLGIDPITGKQKNVNRRGFSTRKDAERFYYDAIKQLQAMEYNPVNSSLTYEEVYSEWVEQYRFTVKESTFNQTTTLYNTYILPVFGSMRIHKITPAYIQRVINGWAVQYKSYKILTHRLFAIFAYAVKMDYLPKNPREKITMPRKKKSITDDAKKEYYTRDELETLLTALEKKGRPIWYTFFRLLAFSGMRKGEALALTWDDVNFNDNTISITKTLAVGLHNKPTIQTPKTDSSVRVIQMDSKTMQVLKRWKHTQATYRLAQGVSAIKGGQYVFNKEVANKPMNEHAPREYLRRFCDANGFEPIKVHGFRHTHASLLFEAGATVKAVQTRLGHSDVSTTMDVYTHVTKTLDDKTAQAFASYMNF